MTLRQIRMAKRLVKLVVLIVAAVMFFWPGDAQADDIPNDGNGHHVITVPDYEYKETGETTLPHVQGEDIPCQVVPGQAGKLCDAASGASRMMNALADQLNQTGNVADAADNMAWLGPYSIAFGLGLLVLAMTLMVGVAQASDGTKVSGWELLAGLGVRAYLFVPAMVALPALVTGLSQLADSMALTFMSQSAGEFIDSMGDLFGRLIRNPLAVVSGGWAAPFGLVLVVLIIFLLLLQIELIIAEFSIYLVTCLMPVGMALALLPRWRQGGSRLIGLLVGVLLVKPALWFTLWVGATVLNGTASDDDAGLFRVFLTTAVLLITAVMVPSLAPMVISRLVASGAESVWDRGGVQRTGSMVSSQMMWRGSSMMTSRAGSRVAGGSAAAPVLGLGAAAARKGVNQVNTSLNNHAGAQK